MDLARLHKMWAERYGFTDEVRESVPEMKAQIMAMLAAKLAVCAEFARSYEFTPSERAADLVASIYGEKAQRAVRKQGYRRPFTLPELFGWSGHDLFSAIETLMVVPSLDITEESSLIILHNNCVMLSLMYEYEADHPGDRFTTNTPEMTFNAYMVTAKAHEAIGFWTAKVIRSQQTKVRNEGTKGKSVPDVIGVLKKHFGGIDGYEALPHGKKTKAVEKINEETGLSERQIQNILSRIKKNPK